MTQEQLATLITSIGLPVLSALALYVIAFLRKKTADVTEGIKNDTVKKYVSIASNAVLQAVQFIAQTYVDSLKAAGTFDAEAQATAFAKAKKVAISLITEEAAQVIAEAYGDFDIWIDTKIEQLVKATK